MKSCAMTDTGVKREMNQDYYFASETPVGNLPNLFIVADGMGGHKAGDYASRYTIERVVAAVSRNSSEEPVTILNEAIQKANSILIEEAREDENKSGMGTTLVVATIIGHKLIAANVGDSRLYVMSDTLHQITRDHSLVQEMVRKGEVMESEAREHPKKNVITRAIGVFDKVEVDFFEVELENHDELLLCSDGLTNMVEDQDMARIMRDHENVDEQVLDLIRAANSNGGKDNITAVIIQPFSDEVKVC